MNGTNFTNKTLISHGQEGPLVSIFSAVPVMIAILALFGNSLIVAVYFKYRNLRDSTTSFIINLGFTDLITGFVLLMVLVLNIMKMPQNNYLACLFAYRSPVYLTIVSQSLILVTTFERYMGICNRENYAKVMTTRVRIGLIVGAWLIPLPLSIAPVFGFNFWSELGCQVPQVIPKWLLLSRSLLIFIQTAIVMALYSRILIKARQLHNRIRPVPLQGLNAYTVRIKGIKRSIRNGKITGLVTIIFFATWLPYHMVLMCYCIGDADIHFGIVYFTQLIGLSNSIMNPFLYAWQRKDIRSRLKQMLRCKGKTQIVHHLGNAQKENRMKNLKAFHNVNNTKSGLHDQLSMSESSKFRFEHLAITQSTTSKGTNILNVTEL